MTAPAGWVQVEVGNLIAGINAGKNLLCEERPPLPHENGIVKISAVTWGHFDPSKSKTAPSNIAFPQDLRIRDGDLLIARANTIELVGATVVVDNTPGNLHLSDKVLRLRADPDIARWLHWFLCSADGRREIEQRATGNQLSMRNIGQDSIRAQGSTAPLPEQRRIVAKLDQLSARSRAARDHLARTTKLAARAKRAILAAAFRGELTAEWRATYAPDHVGGDRSQIDGRARDLHNLPECWSWTAVGAVSAVSGGLTKNPKRSELPIQAPYLRVANVYGNELRLQDVAQIGCTPGEIAKTTLLPGDLLVVEGNGSLDHIGRVALWRDEISGCLHQNHIIRVRLDEVLLPAYGLFWLLSPSGRAAIEAVASSSSGLHTLSISKVEGLPVPSCSPAEQCEIVRRIEAAFARIDRLAAEATRAARLLDRLDERLLAKAFRGDLVPQDPTDEPAARLLARLGAAGAGSAPRRGGRTPTAGTAERSINPRARGSVSQ